MVWSRLRSGRPYSRSPVRARRRSVAIQGDRPKPASTPGRRERAEDSMSEDARGPGCDPEWRGSLPGHTEDAPRPVDAATSEEWWVPPPPDDRLSGGRPETAGLASMGAILRGVRSTDEGPRDVAGES